MTAHYIFTTDMYSWHERVEAGIEANNDTTEVVVTTPRPHVFTDAFRDDHPMNHWPKPVVPVETRRMYLFPSLSLLLPCRFRLLKYVCSLVRRCCVLHRTQYVLPVILMLKASLTINWHWVTCRCGDPTYSRLCQGLAVVARNQSTWQ
jgi:hypothetical protein